MSNQAGEFSQRGQSLIEVTVSYPLILRDILFSLIYGLAVGNRPVQEVTQPCNNWKAQAVHNSQIFRCLCVAQHTQFPAISVCYM